MRVMATIGRRWCMCAILVAAVMSMALSSCAPRKEADRPLRIGVSLPTQRDERWVRDAERMREEAAAAGVEIMMQICDNDAARQLAQCENLMARDVDVLILAPHDANSASVIVDGARALGIPTIAYDRLVMGADVDLYLSFDNVEVGRLMGEYLVKRVPKGDYVVLAGSPTDNNAKLFREGSLSMIRPLVERGDIEIVMDQWVTDWQPTVAMNLMENALTAEDNDIDAVLAPNDNTAGGVIQALAAAGLAGTIPVTGQDAEASAARRIMKGTQSMTVFKDTRLLAAEAIKQAMAMAAGETPVPNATVDNRKIEVPSILLKAVVVDKSNLDTVLIDSGYLERSEVYGK